ncbi:Ser/Thr phosphatase family protein, partial [Ostertagia ostertagi]
MNVVWTTFSSDSSTVNYGTSPSSLKFSTTGSQKEWRSGSITRYSHRALMKDLLPSTTYWYKIGSRTFQFKTLPENPKSYRVCVFGDLGYYHGNSTDSIIRNGLSGMFDFIVHVGDISYDLHSDDGKTGDKFMNQLEPLLSRIPYMVIAGNHENDGKNFTNFQERFWMPHNGYHDNQFYSFDLGPVHWVGLSTEYYGYYDTVGKGPLLTQYSWLQKDLAIRVGHNDLPGLESSFIQYGVDLGFWGHQHFYERFYPVANKKYWDSPNCYHNA